MGMRYGWLAALLLCVPLLSEAAELKRRQVRTQAQAAEARQNFNAMVLQGIREFPGGGGYAAGPADVARVATNAVVWDEARGGLVISPQKAAPTFCSAAVYMVLLRSLQRWEGQSGHRLPAKAWKTLDVRPDQPDGTGAWGRANANGPGLARLVAQLGAGVNFRDIRQAQPGDFLKIFWTPDIGAKERGHLVVYLGLEKKNGTACLRYWSANKPGGYGVKSAPLSRMHNLIFTRITAPQNFARATALPEHDAWLESMQTHSHSFDSVRKACQIR